MTRPLSLTIAVVLQWIAAILGIIAAVGLIISALATINTSVRDQIEKVLADEGVTGVSAAAIGGGVLVAGLVVLAIALFRIFVAVSLARGHNWARILITVFAVLSLITGIGALFGGQVLTGVITIVIELVILWLLWNSASSAYIKAKTAERAIGG